MMHWNTHIAEPEMNETAVIAVFDPADGKPFLLGEIYKFCERHGCWMSESTGLKLKHEAFFWLPEAALLGSLPQ
jgi:hypothetical protein